MSSMRQLEAPSRKTSPRRDSYTISSSSSPTRVAIGEEHAEQPTIGDRAAVGDGDAAGPVPGAHHIGAAIPYHPGAELGEGIAWVATREQVEDGQEHLPGQVGEVGGASRHGEQIIDRPLIDRSHRHDLLGKHVERVAWVPGVLDRAGEHALGDDAGFQQIAPELREDLAAARFADLMAGAPDALQAAGDRAW